MRIIILFLILHIFDSCKSQDTKIKHIGYLTIVDTLKLSKGIQVNREDYFIIYNFRKSESEQEIKGSIKKYSDSFSNRFTNYTIYFYKESPIADTNYIKGFGKEYYYKALLSEKPYAVYFWWLGKFYHKE